MLPVWYTTKNAVAQHPFVVSAVGAVGLAGFAYAMYLYKMSSTYHEKLRNAFIGRDMHAMCELFSQKYPDIVIPKEFGLDSLKFAIWIIESRHIAMVRDVCASYYVEDYTLEYDSLHLLRTAFAANDIDVVRIVLDRNINFSNRYKYWVYSDATVYSGYSTNGKNKYNPLIVRLVLEKGLYDNCYKYEYMKKCYERCLDEDLKKLMEHCMDPDKFKIPFKEKFHALCLAGLKGQKGTDLHWQFK